MYFHSELKENKHNQVHCFNYLEYRVTSVSECIFLCFLL